MKKLLSILLSALMVLSLVPVGVFVFAAEPKTGTTDWSAVDAASASGDLFINSADDWKAFLGKTGTYENATIYLTKDLDVSTVTGVKLADFKGTFDGQGFKLTKVSTLLFTTLTGVMKNIDLDLNYQAVVGDTIETLNGTVSDVIVTGYLFVGGKSDAATQTDNAFIETVNGTVKNVTFSNLQSSCSAGGRYIDVINAGSNVDGITVVGLTDAGHNAYAHAAIGNIKGGAVVKNVLFKDFTRTEIFDLYGTVENLTVDNCTDIGIRNPKSTGLVKNLVFKNMDNEVFVGQVGKAFTINHTPECDAGFTIDGLTVDDTCTAPLFYGDGYLHGNMTIKNMVVNNGAATYFGEVKGVIDGLTINGSTVSPINSVTGTLKNVVNNSGVPVVSSGTLEIADRDQWKAFLSNKNYSFEGVTVKLMGNIDASGVTGVGPIVNFKGTFDGQGFAVNNLETGVFTTMSGTVKDTTFNVSYHGLTANLMGTMSGTLSGVTFTGTLHNRDGEATNASNTNLFINEVTGTINGLTIHDALSYTGGNGNYIAYIKGTARVSNLTISGSSGLVQYMIRVIENGAVINNLVLDGTVRSAINTFNSGAVINGLTCKNHNNIIFLNLNGTVNDLVIDGGGVGTELFYRSVTTHAGTINNLTVKNLANIVINQTDATYAVKAWPANLKLTGKLVVNNSVFPFGNLISKPISGKLFAGYMDAQGNVVENLATHTGDATVKFVDPAMVAVNAQLKDQGDGKYTIRFLTTVDRLDGYKNVKITINGNNKTYGKELTTVYSSVLEGGVSKNAEAVSGVADSKYIVTYEIRNIPAEAVATEFTATATVTMADGSTITSASPLTCKVSTLPGYTA